MIEKVIFTDDFLVVPQGSYTSNIPSVWSTAYQLVVPNGMSYTLDPARRVVLRVTAYEKKEGVNTSADFDITLANHAATVMDWASGTADYTLMGIARGRTSGKITRAKAYDDSTKTMTFSAISGGQSETVDVFYLIADGTVRLQVSAPSRAAMNTFSIFESSLEGLNSKNQTNVNDLLFIPTAMEMKEAWRLELSVYTPATILLKAQDISDQPFTTNWNDLAIIEIPILSKKVVGS